MTLNEREVAVGVFSDYSQAENAVRDLYNAGFRADQIGFVAHRPSEPATVSDTDTTAASASAQGAVVGAVGGGILGGILGAAAALLIPGVGPIVAAGVLASVLGGAAIGAATGGLLGALTGLGVPEEEARYYQTEFEAGRTLVTVRTDGRYREALDILRRNGAYDASLRTGSTASTGYSSTSSTTTTPADYVTTPGGVTYPTTTTSWEQIAPRYQAYWEQHYATSGGRWEDYEPAYRYGWERYSDPRYQGRSWSEVEPEFRRDWESRYRDKPWERFAAAVRRAWEDVTGDTTTTIDSTRPRTDYNRGYPHP